MKPLYKTTIVIWTEYDPSNVMELADLAKEATDGNAYCSAMKSQIVEDPCADPAWDGNEFFENDDDDDDDKEEMIK